MVHLYWEGWSSSMIEGYSELILHSFACIIIIILIIQYIWSFRCSKQSSKSSTNQLIFQVLLLISLIITFIYIYISFYISCLSVLVFNIRYNYGCFYRVSTNISSTLQRALGYTFFLLRLKFAFKDTVYEITNIKFKLLLTSLYITVFSLQAILSYFAYFQGFRCISIEYFILLICSSIIDIIWSILVTYLFIVRLQYVFKMGNNANRKFLYVSKKLTLLSTYNNTHVHSQKRERITVQKHYIYKHSIGGGYEFILFHWCFTCNVHSTISSIWI